MHGSKAPGGNKLPPALPRLPVGPNLRISEVHGPSDKHDTNLPKAFHSDRNFYDTNEVYGLQFPRLVQASSWAQKHQLAGRDITSTKLHELCWQGWNNFALRSLAQGRYASILFARDIKEATFMSFFMQKFRESKADLDQFAEVYCDQQGITADSSLNESAQKSAKMKHFCEFIYNQCKPFQQQELVDAQECIRELEHQLVQAQKSAPTSSSVKPPSKRPSIEDPTPDNKKRRLPLASPASQKPVKPAQTLLQKAFDPNFESSKVLESQAPGFCCSSVHVEVDTEFEPGSQAQGRAGPKLQNSFSYS